MCSIISEERYYFQKCIGPAAYAVSVRARILGPTSLFVGSRAVDLGPVRPRLVLAKLVLHAGQVVRTAQVDADITHRRGNHRDAAASAHDCIREATLAGDKLAVMRARRLLSTISGSAVSAG